MVRVRLVALGFLAVVVVGLGFWPAVLGYTFLAGEEGVAQVTGCRDRLGMNGTRRLDCSGRWRDAEGGSGSGHISGVDESDVRRSVAVRIGPVGPYAGGFGHSWPVFLIGAPLLGAPPIVLIVLVRALGPARATARRLLAAPPDGATLLKVDPTRAVRPDGPEYGSLRETPPPPGFQPVRLPGAHPRQNPESLFTAAAGIMKDGTDFAAVSGPAGEPLFVLERRGFRAHEPETWLLDPLGAARGVVRKVRAHPVEFELLSPGGERLGRLATLPKTGYSCFAAHDEHGRRRAVLAASGRGWIVRIDPGTPPLLHDLTLAFAFDSARLQL